MARTKGASALRDDILAIKRERILKEAVELFYEQGYLPTKVDDIAQRLGATKPFIYYHFSSKVALLSAICSRVMQEALEVTEAAADIDATPTERLAVFIGSFTELALDRQKHVAIYFREELNLPPEVAAEVAGVRKEIDYRLRKILKDGKKSGEFTFENAAVASQLISGMISYTFAWYHEDDQISKKDIQRQMLDHALRCCQTAANRSPSGQ